MIGTVKSGLTWPSLSVLLLLAAPAWADAKCAWPVLRIYENESLCRVKMPLGGIGTGTISLSGRGGLVDWEIRNSPHKGFVPNVAGIGPAFVLRASGGGKTVMRLLEGPLGEDQYEGGMGSPAPNHGYPRFSGCAFKAAYPLAQVVLSDPDMPVRAMLEAMNPLVPGDEDSSGLPVALLRWRFSNTSERRQELSIAAAFPNPSFGTFEQKPFSEGALRGVALCGRCGTDAEPDTRCGEFVVAVPAEVGEQSFACNFADSGWGDLLDRFWRRLYGRGDVADCPDGRGTAVSLGELAVRFSLGPGESRDVPFVLAWRFPHRRAWPVGFGALPQGPFKAEEDVGNRYCQDYPSAVAAALTFWERLPELEEQTVRFVRSVLDVEAPDVVKEAALFNLSTLRTETCFRTKDGHFYGWEGVLDGTGSCFGSCTHVWGYEHALIDLWPALAKDMTELQFGRAMRDDGLINFRIGLPLEAKALAFDKGAADGQMQCLIKAYECWHKSGDDGWMRRLYPRLRKALEFCWCEGGWDADRDGVMEGCQHNTMDVNYYGPNPQMAFLYLAALKAVAEVAELAGDTGFAVQCRELLKAGSQRVEALLFNGSYYEQRVRPATGRFAGGTCFLERSRDLSRPDFQLANGCLIDQLLGDCAARAVGLGPVADEGHVRTTLETILARNRREANAAAFNPMRDFVLAGERSLRMAWYPDGKMPEKPFPYYRETMTGFEYVVAAHLAMLGEKKQAEEIVRDIRSRYDGRKRNPFDEVECGHHYVRALASWTVFRAFAGLADRPFANPLGFVCDPGVFKVSEGGVTSALENRMFRTMPSGKARSAAFRIDSNYLSFHYQSTSFSPETSVRFCVDGRDQFSLTDSVVSGAQGTYALDLRTLRGRRGVLTVGDAGTWDEITVRDIRLSDEPPAGARILLPRSECRPLDKLLDGRTGDFLALPISSSAPCSRIVISVDGEDVMDWKVRLVTSTDVGETAYVPVGHLKKGRLRVRTEEPVFPACCSAAIHARIRLVERLPTVSAAGRPKYHFYPAYGASGDMIGFFRYGDEYHLGYLTDPVCGNWIETCCWGHAVSRDLCNWAELPLSDCKGNGQRRSSGCCFVDEKNRSGLGRDGNPAVLLFGFLECPTGQCFQVFGNDKGPDPHPETLSSLHVKVSTDGGRTFHPVECGALMKANYNGAHDPDIVYYPPEDKFVMVVHDRRDGVWGVDFYESRDLLSWSYMSTVPNMWETPNFFPLAYGEKTMWVLQECLGGYLVGEFDGRRFLPDAHGKRPSPYAGRAFAPRTLLTADGRRIWMAALMSGLPGGGATLPVELSLKSAPDGKPTLSLVPAREILSSGIRRWTDGEGRLCLYDAPILEKFCKNGFSVEVSQVRSEDALPKDAVGHSEREQ